MSNTDHEIAIVSIGPDLAASWLASNLMNRPLSESTVNRYANAMRRGEWKLNGETIVFADNGLLLNGQHRLHACIKAGREFDCFVVRGVPPSTFDTQDGGKPRSPSDALSIAGKKNYVKLSAGARSFMKLHLSGRAQNEITNAMVVDCVNKEPLVTHWTEKYVSTKNSRLFPASIIGVLAATHKYHGESIAETFYQKAVLGIGLVDGDAEGLLRDRFIDTKRGVVLTTDLQLSLMVKAANFRILGKPVRVLKLMPNEQAMRLVGITADRATGAKP